MSQAIQTYVAAVTAAFDKMKSAVDNIAADEQAMATQIADLKAQLVAGNSLSADDQAALDATAAAAADLASKSQALADSIPDVAPPPPPPPPPPAE